MNNKTTATVRTPEITKTAAAAAAAAITTTARTTKTTIAMIKTT